MGMKSIAIALVLVACGGKQQPAGSSNDSTPVKDTRTELERRRDAACAQLGPKITECAVADAKADLAAGKIQQSQFDKDTAPDVRKKNTEKFIEECSSQAMSSRQVRVLEVCFHQEQDCEPLLGCLDNLTKPQQP